MRIGGKSLLGLVLFLNGEAQAASPLIADWPVTGGDPGDMRYSPLAEIDRTNVARLQVAWTYRHGDYRSGWPDPFKGTAFQATPLVVDNRLIFSTPYNRVIALAPETGKELWTFDPQIDTSRRFANLMVNRGVAYWKDPAAPGPCASRIFLGTLDARLLALDAATGKRCTDFGVGGEVNLLDGIEHVVDPWEYNVTSPPTVIGENVIVGSSIADEVRRISPSGAVRAYHARTGALVWRFNTIPQGGEAGTDTWERESWRITGGANVWSTMTADLARGLVFLPVSTAGPDFIGVDRPGANLFSDAVVALDAKTGALRWHFQTVHHDLWDYDLAAPPTLVRVQHKGREIDAVAQGTKTGLVFLLDRDTGKPLFPVEERPVPRSETPGETSWPTQPFPSKPPALVPQRLTENDLRTDDLQLYRRCLARFRTLRNEGIFTPPSTQWTILYPGTGGGVNWSGGAFDPQSGLWFAPTNNDVHLIRLDPLPAENFNETEGIVMHTGWGGLRWLLWRTGTGLRYGQIRDELVENGRRCHKPPWGMLHAVDLNTGEIRWQMPVGQDAETGVQGLPNFGPPLVTAGGLVFHAGSRELKLRAHDSATGAVLATFDLPAGLHAGPITYKLTPEGKQYLVIAPGGHARLGSQLGDYVIAYTLPDASRRKTNE
ncbi:MAG: pyrroloquinoline quinone-dependent dehydrogenase [Deltaproteobacteria bacterium]|nr:pyrroloquinoline quinone-dependent dehydrogenase [Deltaproteobacteria bacterium]